MNQRQHLDAHHDIARAAIQFVDAHHDISRALIQDAPLPGAANINRAMHIYQHAQAIAQYPSFERNLGNIAVQGSDGSLTTLAALAKNRQG